MTKKDGGEKYVLTLTREQARVAQNALELYARLKIGQFDRITELMLDVRSVDEYCQRRDLTNDLLKIVAGIIYGKNEYGQPNCKKDDAHHIAWNIYATLRYHMAWHDRPEGGWGVCYDKPYPWGGQPIPDCKTVEGDRVIRTTAGRMNKRPIDAEQVGDILHALLLSETTAKEPTSPTELLARIIEQVDELPTMEQPDGKRLMQKRYPRVMVVDRLCPEDGLRRIGDNSHDRLEIHQKNGSSYIAFTDVQSMASTEYEDGGYAFVGVADDENHSLAVPFDTVWVEDKEKEAGEDAND